MSQGTSDSPLPQRFLVAGFGVVPLVFYVATAAPSIGWIDAPLVAYYAAKPVTGVWVNFHNLFNLIGHGWIALFSGLDPHRALNLLCAVFGALTVHFAFLATWTITQRVAPAVFGALALMVSHSLWWHSTMLEVYTLNTALITLMVWLVARHARTGRATPLVGAAFSLGLGCANHVLMGLFAAGPLAMLLVPSSRKAMLRPKVAAGLLLAFLVGFSPYLVVFGHELAARLQAPAAGDAWTVLAQMIDATTGGYFKRRMFTPLEGRGLWFRLNYPFLLLVNFPSAALVCGLAGFVSLWRRKAQRSAFAFFSASFAAQVLWSSNYVIWDMYAFALPAWVLFGIAVGIGADAVSTRLRQWGRTLHRGAIGLACASLLVGPWLYAQVPRWAAQSDGFWRRYFSRLSFVSNLWDPAEYFANPDKRGYVRARDISQAVLTQLPHGAHLLDDDGKGHYPIGVYYRDTLGQRPDLQIHALFGPRMDDQMANDRARILKAALDRSEPVFVASPYWPERPVLDRLFTMLASDREGRSLAAVRQLSVESLEATFPRFFLRRFRLLEGDDAFIYALIPRQNGRVADDRVEAEEMPVLDLSATTTTSTRWVGPGHGGSFDRAWEAGREGGRIVLGFRLDVPTRRVLRVRLTHTTGIDMLSVSIDDEPIRVELGPGARDVDLGTHDLVAGEHRLTLEAGADSDAKARVLGLDTLELLPPEDVGDSPSGAQK